MKKLALVVFVLFALGTMPLFAQAQGKPKSICQPGQKLCVNVCIAANKPCNESTQGQAQRELNKEKAQRDKRQEEARAKEKAEKEAAEKAQKCPPKTKRCSYGCIPADKKCTDGSDKPASAPAPKKMTKQEQEALIKNYELKNKK